MEKIKGCLGRRKNADDVEMESLEQEGKMAVTKSHTRVVKTL
jgi:hypothetical protein